MKLPIGTVCVLLISLAQLNAQDTPKRPATPPVWHPNLERFTPAGTIQTEFGSPLSEAGYRKLLAALPWRTPSERADYYFDAYDGRQFLLRTGVMPLKVRIKVKKQTPLWQVSRFVAKDQVAVGELAVYVHTTESWEGQLETRQAAALLAASDTFASRLGAGGAALRAAADMVEAAWKTMRAETPPPGLMVIDRMLAGHAYRFYPRKVTSGKVRLSATLPGFDKPSVTLMLGSEPEIDGNGNQVMTYGLEAEAARSVSAAEARAIALAIGRFLRKAGITAGDQQDVVSLSNEYTLRQLCR